MVESEYIVGDDGSPVLVAPAEVRNGGGGSDEYVWWASDWQSVIAEIDGLPQNGFQSWYPGAMEYDVENDHIYTKASRVTAKHDRNGDILEYNDDDTDFYDSADVGTLTIGHGQHQNIYFVNYGNVHAHSKSDLSSEWMVSPTEPSGANSNSGIQSIVFTSQEELFILWDGDGAIQKLDPSDGSVLAEFDGDFFYNNHRKLLSNSQGQPLTPTAAFNRDLSSMVWSNNRGYEYAYNAYTIGNDIIFAIRDGGPYPWNIGGIEKINALDGGVGDFHDDVSSDVGNVYDALLATPSHLITANNTAPANWNGDGGTGRFTYDMDLDFSNYTGYIEFMTSEQGDFSTWYGMGDWSKGTPTGIVGTTAVTMDAGDQPIIKPRLFYGDTEGGDDGIIYALDANTGNESWATTVDAGLGDDYADYFSTIVSGDIVYQHLDHSEVSYNSVFAIDKLSGDHYRESFGRWSLRSYYDGISIVDGSIYSSSDDTIGSYELPVDDQDAGTEWSTDISDIRTAPFYYNGRVFISDGNNNIQALDASDGSILWTENISDHVPTTLTAVQGEVYAITNTSGDIVSLDTSTGNIEWTFNTGEWMNVSPTIVNGTLYAGTQGGTSNSHLYAIDTSDGSEEWSFSTDDDINSSATVFNSSIYFGCDDHNFYCLDESTGTQQWSYDTGTHIESDPTVWNGMVYFTSFDTVYCLDTSTGSEVWTRPADANSLTSSPTIVDATSSESVDSRVLYGTNGRHDTFLDGSSY